ncbi:uncharacterized protein E0L32_012342 [Thyridium curvatum]|uniref:Uncharacterized protein n=1 Tax=Thyridium curvatum TaxID=1093900 RepID=A0A507BJY3_9PEZI|nr:uncharacterized protein E0L32_012342 [Thyridium curvatum]TPX17008.1 hypothetical protein E0L32_012342 [Thyridium curvatum]
MVEERQTSATATTYTDLCTSTPAYTQQRQPPTFLTLPYEIRLQIYESLLLYPSSSSSSPSTSSPPPPTSLFSPRILLACRQTHAEARPVLYARNTFLAHASLLTSFPSLTGAHRPLREPAVLPLIRRWRLRLRLDCDPPWTAAQLSAAFSGADLLVLEVWQAAFLAAGRGVLTLFEGVRGVRDPRVTGSLTGFEAYARWLEGVMRQGPGRDVGQFDESWETSGLVPMHSGGLMA